MILLAYIAVLAFTSPVAAVLLILFVIARRIYWWRRTRGIKWEVTLYPQFIVRSPSAPMLIKDVEPSWLHDVDEPFLCCARFSWGDGTHELTCKERAS